MSNLNPAALSKINWTQVVGAAAMLGSIFGFNLSPEVQVQVVTGIALVTQLVTVIFRSFFTAK